MKNYSAAVYARVETNTNGVIAVTYPTSAGTVRGILLPTGGEIVQKMYGLEYIGEFEFYAKSRNSSLVQGSRLMIDSVWYDIIAIRDYQKVVTCLLKRVIT